MEIKILVVGPVATNCYIVSEGTDTVIFDPGAEAERILSYVSENGLDVSYIFLTHGHFDHVLAAAAIKSATGAKIAIHRFDADCLTDESRSLAARVRLEQEPVLADIIIGDGDCIEMDSLNFKWLHTPGHTVGSCVILCGSAMFSGDTLFEDDCGRCDLDGGDYAEMLKSLRRLAALEGDYDVYPGHDVSTTLSREREKNVNMREALETLK